MSDFRKELEGLINRYGREDASNTPDFLLATFLTSVLDAYDATISARDKWFGIDPWTGKKVTEVDGGDGVTQTGSPAGGSK